MSWFRTRSLRFVADDLFFRSGPVLALCLASDDAVNRWRKMLGPKEVAKAVEEEPECLR